MRAWIQALLTIERSIFPSFMMLCRKCNKQFLSTKLWVCSSQDGVGMHWAQLRSGHSRDLM